MYSMRVKLWMSKCLVSWDNDQVGLGIKSLNINSKV